MKLATADEMAAVDRCACECHGVALTELMDRAGRRTAEAAELLLGSAGGRRVVFFCGCGNNGGDGFVAAETLRARGATVLAILVGLPGKMRPEARQASDAARAAGVEVIVCHDEATLAAARGRASGADLVVDALLGTGFTPPARDLVKAAIRLINSLGLPALAVDVPSGLASDGGGAGAEVVRATATVTFGYPKPGLLFHPGAQFVGRLWRADIGLPPGTDSLVAGNLRVTTAGDLGEHFAPRDPQSHKGTFGHVLLLAGSQGMVGAAALAARGALRAGAGLATVALPVAAAPAFLPGLPEAMILALPSKPAGAGGNAPAALLRALLPDVGALAVGPGLARTVETAHLLRELFLNAQLPLIIDAEALRVLAAAGPPALRDRKTPAVLTPHPGELAGLLGTSTTEVQADRVAAARQCASRFGAVVVLKGARTLVAAPGEPVWVNPTGNPGMAAAGMGDVLTGVIAAHLARGMSPLMAALSGVYLHGLAGDCAATETGPWGILASEVADRIPLAVRSLVNPDEARSGNLTLVVP